MKLAVWSDLHLELDDDETIAAWLDDPLPSADVLVLAGDIASGPRLPARLAAVAAKFPDVLYVHGNHEFYHSDRATVLARTAVAVERTPHLRFLDCDVTEIGGERFLGTPLWFRRAPGAPESWLTDFAVIDGYRSWVYEENARALRFLEAELRPGDIVVTHHLPAPPSVHPVYRGEPSNAFFLCDVSSLILARRPKLWIHGHTHIGCNYSIGETRVICNPRGYPGQTGTRFQKHLVLDV